MANVLIIDDDADLREVLFDFLVEAGHQVRLARDGREGLRALTNARTQPDVILLDVEMPKLTGPELAWKVFLHDAGLERIPIVLFSGSADVSQVAAEVGTPYYLAKPTAPDRLLKMLTRVARERTPPAPPAARQA